MTYIRRRDIQEGSDCEVSAPSRDCGSTLHTVPAWCSWSSCKFRQVETGCDKKKTLLMSGIGRSWNFENPITNMGVTRLVMWNRKLSLSRNRKSNSLPVNVPGHVHVGGNILKAKWQRPTLLVSVQHFVKEISVSEVVWSSFFVFHLKSNNNNPWTLIKLNICKPSMPVSWPSSSGRPSCCPPWAWWSRQCRGEQCTDTCTCFYTGNHCTVSARSASYCSSLTWGTNAAGPAKSRANRKYI